MSDDMPAWAMGMEGRLASTGERLQAGLTALRTDVTPLRTEMTALRTEMIALRTDLMERMDRLQNGMTLLRDDVSVNFGAVETVRRVNDNTREELRALGDVVSAMHRQIHRLQNDVRELRGEP